MSASPDLAAPPGRYRRRRLPRWARVVLTLLAVVVLGVVALVCLLVWGLSGGWDGLRGAAEPGDREVATAREASGAELDPVTARAVAAVGGSEVARVRVDRCEQGQNNWKIHDGYTLRCERGDVVVLDVGRVGVLDTARRLGDRLRAEGWQAESGVTALGTADATGPGAHQRTFSYRGPTSDPKGVAGLTVGIGDQGKEPAYGLLPYSGSELATVEGDRAALEQSLTGYDGSRVVVSTTLRYFEDS